MSIEPLTFTLHLASDHAGLAHKTAVKVWLEAQGYRTIDHGTYQFDPLDDFPDFIKMAAAAVSANPASNRAIIFGGSGQGEAMVANRFPHVRATVYYGGDESIILLSKQHNDANVLSIGARFVDVETCKRVIALWLTEAFISDEKYERRNQKIERITKSI